MQHELRHDLALRLFEAVFEQEAMGLGVREVAPREPRWLRVNRRLCELLGYSREELLGRTSLDVTPPEDRDIAIAHNERLRSGEVRSYSREKRFLRKDGQVVWTNLWLSSVLDVDGRPAQVIMVVQDISERKRAEAALVETENRLRTVIDTSPAGITLKDRDGRFLLVNRAYARWMGTDPSALIGRTIEELFPDDQAAAIRADDLQTFETGAEQVQESRRSFLDGVTRSLLTHKAPVHSVTGDIVAVSTVLTDISARIHAESIVRDSEQRFRDFAESSSDWLWETDADLGLTYLSDRFYEKTGLDAATPLVRLEWQSDHAPATGDSRREWDTLVATLTGRRPFRNLELSFRSRGGRERRARLSGAPVFDDHGIFRGFRGTGTDITEAYRLSQQLTWQASHDALTGLLNRAEFERRLERAIEACAVEGAEHALCYIDLDQFKIINDTCGHTAGDALLGQLGQMLPTITRRHDTLARLGGDEFGLLLEHCPVPRAVEIATSLREAIDGFRFPWREQVFRVGASIGLVPITGTQQSVADVLSAADRACYAAKEHGRNRLHVYQPGDAELALRTGEMRWVARIDRGLEEGRFQLWSQPILPADPDVREGEHLELLLRLLDEDGTLIAPDAFLPAAERFGLAVRIDQWVIDAAFDWLARNPRRRDAMSLCSINLSGATLGDPEVLARIKHRLNADGLPADKICFEITETTAIGNLARALAFMKELAALGCRFALDDFGSGMSSFAYLKTLPVDYLKIDGTFVRDIMEDPLDLALVRSINEIGKLMGKRTIAEFVENDGILGRLRTIGVDYVQGYGLARPEPLGDTG